MSDRTEMHYGLTVVNADCQVEIVGAPDPTWRDYVSFLLWELVFPSLLVAGAFTSFAVGFGLIR